LEINEGDREVMVMIRYLKEIVRKSKRAAELARTIPAINRYRKKPLKLGKRIGPVETFARLGIPPESRVIFDVGANVGEFALMAKEYFYEPEIYCFEPVRSTYDELLRSVSGFPNIKTFRLGLFNRDGTSEINITNFSPANSMIDIHRDYNEMFGHAVKGTEMKETIETRKLDSVVAENMDKIGKIDLLKIDVEGVEYEVLEGGKDTLKKKVDRIYVEVSLVRKGRAASEFLKIYELLDDAGFALETFHCVDYKKVKWYDRVSQFDALFTKKELFQD
jgi:FkbM family methyltransferase